MKTTKVLHENIQETTYPGLFPGKIESIVVKTPFRNLKKIIILTSLAGIGLFFNACTAGYVATEPTYVEYSRPQQPSTYHVWIDGDWVYNRQTHAYVQHNGSWQRPVQGRSYQSGHWQSTPKGHQWSQGHWQKQGKKNNRRNP